VADSKERSCPGGLDLRVAQMKKRMSISVHAQLGRVKPYFSLPTPVSFGAASIAFDEGAFRAKSVFII